MNFKYILFAITAYVLVANTGIEASRGQLARKCLLPLGQFTVGLVSLTVAYGANRLGNGFGSLAQGTVKEGSKNSSEDQAGSSLLFGGVPALGAVVSKALAFSAFGIGGYLMYRSVKNGQKVVELSKKTVE